MPATSTRLQAVIQPVPAPPATERSLSGGVLWTALGSGVYLVCQYAMLMVLAKLGTPVLLGDFSLALAITAPIITLSQMQLRQVQVTDVQKEYGFAEYLYARAALTGAALLVIAVLAACASRSLELAGLIVMLGLAKCAESVSDIFYGYLQAHERMDLVSLSMALKGVLSLAVFAGVFWLTGSLFDAAAGMAAVWTALLLFLDRRLQQRVGRESLRVPRRLRQVVARLTKISFPLALASGLASLSGMIPRYYLAGYHGSEAVALFTVAAAPLALLNVLSFATSQATLSRAATVYQTGDLRAFRRIACGITLLQVGLGAASTVVFWLWGAQLLRIFFAPEYAPAAPVMVVLCAGVTIGSLSAYGQAIYQAGRAFWLQPVPIFIGVILQVGLCGWLARPWGALGAASADALKYLFCAIFISVTGAWVLRRQRQSTGEVRA